MNFRIKTLWTATKRVSQMLPEEYLTRQRWYDQEEMLEFGRQGYHGIAHLHPMLKDQCWFQATGVIYTVRPGARFDGTVSEAFYGTWVRFKFPNTRYPEDRYASQPNVGFYNGSVVPTYPLGVEMFSAVVREVADIGNRYLATTMVSPHHALVERDE